MKIKNLAWIVTLTVIICVSAGHSVRADHQNPAGSTLRGTVKFDGTMPPSKPINMGADPSCAKQHVAAALNQEMVIDSKGGLQNVIVFVSDGLGDRTFDPPTRPAVIEQKGCMYQPRVLALQANQPLEVINDDPTTHNIHAMPANNREWNEAEQPGSKVEESFPRQEVGIPVKCNIHPWMRSYIAVFKHPYFAVTGKDGSFELGNLPPGTYTIQAWHEKLGMATQKITIGSNESKDINFVLAKTN
jgi:plastocyanin